MRTLEKLPGRICSASLSFPLGHSPSVFVPRSTAGISARLTAPSSQQLRWYRQRQRQWLPPAGYRSGLRCDVLHRMPYHGKKSATNFEQAELFQDSRGLLGRVHRLRLHADAGTTLGPAARLQRRRWQHRVTERRKWRGEARGTGQAIPSDPLDGGGRGWRQQRGGGGNGCRDNSAMSAFDSGHCCRRLGWKTGPVDDLFGVVFERKVLRTLKFLLKA